MYLFSSWCFYCRSTTHSQPPSPLQPPAQGTSQLVHLDWCLPPQSRRATCPQTASCSDTADTATATSVSGTSERHAKFLDIGSKSRGILRGLMHLKQRQHVGAIGL